MNLAIHFKINFNLNRHHKYSLTEVEDMMPWERDAHVDMVFEAMNEEREAQSKQQ